MRVPAALTGLMSAGLMALTGCSGDDAAPATATASSTAASPLYTLSPLPMPTQPPPTGTLRASMRQSSRDTLLNRFEVWVDNDTTTTIRPTRVVYRDGRLRTAVPGTRLRSIPSQSERGFPIYQPARPTCADTPTGRATTDETDGADGDAASGARTLTVTYRTGSGVRTVTTTVEDETDVVGRYTSARCLDLAVREVATLHFADAVAQDPPGGTGADGQLTLLATTSGRSGHTLTIDTVTGTPVLSPVEGDAWRPGVTMTGGTGDQRIDLPVKPTRCDAHAFAESGGATTFLVGIHLDGVAGQLRILMSTRGSKHAIDFAQTDCGLLTTTDGGTAGPS